jgi:tetratricopeptide (TPR) repeat protein
MSGKLAEYLVESRTPNVEDICEWIASPGELLLCIHGTAGVGKSTLAGHLSKELRAAGRLAGSIFLGTFPTETSGPETIIKMLAHEIGSIHPQTRPKILDAMQQCHGTSLETHLQKYILEPIRLLNHPYPLVVIVDALDEWRDHPTFLSALGYLNSNTSVIKVIGTSRLNPVASCLPGIDKVSVRPYHLSPVSMGVIKKYFEKHLESVPWVDGRKAHPRDIDQLAELSGGLPVWAATVIALLSYQFSESPPHDVLADIVGSRRQVGGSDGLGVLYENALKRLFTTPETQQQFRRYFGAIIALQAPLSLSDFSTLTGISPHLINKIQAALPAFHTRSPPPGSEKTVHPATAIFHLSLIEHVQATGAETAFAISVFESHSALGLSCLQQLSSLPSPSPHHSSPLRAIQDYAVRYSPYHVANGTPRSNDGWSQTKHCGILRAMSSGTQQQWAALFLNALMPGENGLELETEDGILSILMKLADRMGQSGGDQWGFQVACLEVAVRIDDGNAEAWSRLGWRYRGGGERMGSIQMLEEALAAFRRALQLQPEPHLGHANSLKNVALALWSCYQLNGSQDTLDEMISCSQKALTLCPVLQPDRNRYLTTLANALGELYRHNRDLQTLKEVISLHRQGLELCPAPHPERSTGLNNLAKDLQFLHGHDDGDIDALKEAISLHREALPLRPVPHPYRSSSLDNLASALDCLYRSNGDERALNEAISLYHEALALRPAPHPGRSFTLNNLADSLQARYKYNGDISTLNVCISLHREALGLRHVPHPDRPTSLSNLADVLLLQFEQNREVGILDEAISLRRELLILRPPGHRYRKADLKGFLHLLEMRREVTGDDRDRGEIDDVKAELAALGLS